METENEAKNYNTNNLLDLAENYLWEKLPFKEKIKSFKNKQAQNIRQQRNIKNQITADPDQTWILEILLDLLKKEMDEYEQSIRFYTWENNPKSEGSLNIGQARLVPITNFIQFNRSGFAKCLWHEDNDPSMKYHKPRNKVHCFSCGIDNDVVDVVMKLNGWDLPTSVKFLTNKN